MWLRKIVGKIRVFDDRKVVEEMDIIKRIKKNGTRKKEVLQALQKEDRSAWEEDKVAYMEGRIYVPNNKDIKEEILKEHHSPADVGHLGQHRMQELIKRTYWWPGLKEDPSIGNSRRTMARHQYQHDRSIAKIKRNRCHTSNCGLFHKDDQTKSDDNKFIIRRNCQDLQR